MSMETTPPSPSLPTIEYVLPVEGMTCASCVNRIERFLRKTPGVAEATVNLATERATVRFDPAVAGRAELVGGDRGGRLRRPAPRPQPARTPPPATWTPRSPRTTPSGRAAQRRTLLQAVVSIGVGLV